MLLTTHFVLQVPTSSRHNNLQPEHAMAKDSKPVESMRHFAAPGNTQSKQASPLSACFFLINLAVVVVLLAISAALYLRLSEVASTLAMAQYRLHHVESQISNGSTIQSVILPHLRALLNRGTNMHDFASARGGASIVPELTRSTWKSSTPPPSRIFRSKTTEFASARAYLAITPDMEYGSCWSFNGPTGHLGVSLPIPVHITNVTIDHISKDLVPDPTPAPRDMILWGLLEGDALLEYRRIHQVVLRNRSQPSQSIREGLRLLSLQSDAAFVEVARFQYNQTMNLAHSQTFPIHPDVADSGLYFGIVVLDILSNWGSQRTCLYRVRIHGD